MVPSPDQWHTYDMISRFLQHTFRQWVVYFLIQAILFTPGGFAVSDASAFSVGDEKKIGRELLGLVQKNFVLLDEPDISQYINTLGKEILQVTGVQFFDYHFFIIDDPEFNAFAAPSGLIFVHSGLLEEMSSEEELISVLAHECGHVSSRHIASRMKKMTKTSIATAALLIAGVALGGGAIGEALITGSMAAGTSMNLKFSRQDEEEADRLAYGWMKDLHTDPTAMAAMLRKMHRISVYRMANIPPYLLTHPEPKRRLGYVQDLLLSDDSPSEVSQRDNFSFLRIKHRVLAQSKTTEALENLASRTLGDPTTSPLEKIMAHYGRHLVFLEKRDFKSAREELAIVQKAYPNRPILDADFGVIALKEGNYNGAKALLLKAVSQTPKDAYSRYNLARAYQRTGEEEKALPLLLGLLNQGPEDASLHYQIGQIRTKMGDIGAGHYHLGRYFWYKGDTKMATFHLDRAIEDGKTTEEMKKKAKTFLKEIQEEG